MNSFMSFKHPATLPFWMLNYVHEVKGLNLWARKYVIIHFVLSPGVRGTVMNGNICRYLDLLKCSLVENKLG